MNGDPRSKESSDLIVDCLSDSGLSLSGSKCISQDFKVII